MTFPVIGPVARKRMIAVFCGKRFIRRQEIEEREQNLGQARCLGDAAARL